MRRAKAWRGGSNAPQSGDPATVLTFLISLTFDLLEI